MKVVYCINEDFADIHWHWRIFFLHHLPIQYYKCSYMILPYFRNANFRRYINFFHPISWKVNLYQAQHLVHQLVYHLGLPKYPNSNFLSKAYQETFSRLLSYDQGLSNYIVQVMALSVDPLPIYIRSIRFICECSISTFIDVKAVGFVIFIWSFIICIVSEIANAFPFSRCSWKTTWVLLTRTTSFRKFIE